MKIKKTSINELVKNESITLSTLQNQSFVESRSIALFSVVAQLEVEMWKRLIFMPLPPIPLRVCSSNISSYHTNQNGSGQSLPESRSLAGRDN